MFPETHRRPTGDPLPPQALPQSRPSPGPPKISPSPAGKIRSFLPSLGVFSLNFGCVFESRNPEMCTFVLLGCRNPSPPAAPPDGAAGVRTRQPENSKRACTFQGPCASNTKIQREDPERERRKKIVAGGQNSAKVWAPSGLHLLGPHLLWSQN